MPHQRTQDKHVSSKLLTPPGATAKIFTATHKPCRILPWLTLWFYFNPTLLFIFQPFLYTFVFSYPSMFQPPSCIKASPPPQCFPQTMAFSAQQSLPQKSSLCYPPRPGQISWVLYTVQQYNYHSSNCLFICLLPCLPCPRYPSPQIHDHIISHPLCEVGTVEVLFSAGSSSPRTSHTTQYNYLLNSHIPHSWVGEEWPIALVLGTKKGSNEE